MTETSGSGTVATERAQRTRRQNAVVLVVASVVGLWLGAAAPAASPVAPAGAGSVPGSGAPAVPGGAGSADTPGGAQ